MKIEYNKKLARCLQSVDTCQKKYGAQITKLLFRLINELKCVKNFKQLWTLQGNFHSLKYLPFEHIYSITLKHPYRCVMSLNIKANTITLVEVLDYHGKIEKLLRQ